jgi:hypothetical protein
MNGKPNPSLFHVDELDETVARALCDMLLREPAEFQVQSAIEQMRLRTPSLRSVDRKKATASRVRLVRCLAASLLLSGLWLAAQTDAWAKIALDFQRRATSEAREPALQPSSASPAGAAVRFVLILHVVGLMAGMVGFLVSWASSNVRWMRTEWGRATTGHSGRRYTPRIHRAALVAFALGVFFGCIWSQATRSAWWSWTPKEAVALITLGVGVLWYVNNGSTGGDATTKRMLREALVASLSFWMIALLYSLASVYDSAIHSYGFPTRGPTLIVLLLAANLVAAWALHRCIAYRRTRRYTEAANSTNLAVEDQSLPPGDG